MNIYLIYTPISPITLVLACLDFDCRFEWVKPSNRRKNEVKGNVDQRNLQRRSKMTQHRQNPRPKLKHQRSTKRCVEEASGPGQTGATTGCSWDPPRPVVVDARPCEPVLLGILPFSSCLFLFMRVFLVFAFIIGCIWTLWAKPIHSHPLSFHLH